jgi:hypothetical protein
MDHPCLKCSTPMVVDQNSPAGYPLDLARLRLRPTRCIRTPDSCGFPPSYRTFLAQYGAGFWKGGLLEIVGLFHQPDISAPPYWENVVTWNLQRRGATAFRRAMSRSVTTVWKPLCLDTGALELESPVAVLGP